MPSPSALPSLALAAGGRLEAAVQPAHVAVMLVAVLGQELVFRGWLQRVVGPAGAAIAFVLVITPLDPVRGVLFAILLHGLVVLSRGSVAPAVLARWVAAVTLVGGLHLTGTVIAPLARSGDGDTTRSPHVDPVATARPRRPR